MYRLTQAPIARKVTPEQAEDFLKFNNFKGQRPLMEFKARRYSQLIKQGMMRPVDIAFALCPDGNRYMMNGQHVCQGCIWAGVEMNAIITNYKCTTWEEAWMLFATFDVHASRTQNQIFVAARGLFANEELRDVPLRVLSTCGSALIAINGPSVRFTRNEKTADKTSRPLAVEEHGSDVLWVSTFCDAEFLIRVGCVAAMLVTRRRDREQADVFWRKIQTGLNFKSRQDPEKKLFDYLQSPHRGDRANRTHHEFVYATCISWWNSWRTGTPRKSVKVNAMQELPKAL